MPDKNRTKRKMKNIIDILIIDDSDIDRMIFRSHLRHVFDKINLYEVRQGNEALNFLENSLENFPKLIIVDINMPILNGFQFLEKYEAIFWKQHPQTHVYMISSSEAEEDIAKAKGFTSVKGYLTKPFEREKAKNLLNSVLILNNTDNGTRSTF